jgi:hypothetical protein
MADVWTRFCVAATDTAGIPETFTPYNARHTGISWAIDKGVDLQKVRQRAGHGSLEVTSRYAAILDDRDTSLADALEEIFDTSRTPVGRQEKTAELHDAAAHHAPVPAAEPDWLLSPRPRLRSPSRPGREAVAALDAHTFATEPPTTVGCHRATADGGPIPGRSPTGARGVGPGRRCRPGLGLRARKRGFRPNQHAGLPDGSPAF